MMAVRKKGSNVVTLRPAKLKQASTKVQRWQGEDSVFLHRSQIRIGVVLTYFGRINHGQRWRVTEIMDYRTTDRGRKLEVVTQSTDAVTLVRIGSNQTRRISFMYLSYSAIWRLA